MGRSAWSQRDYRGRGVGWGKGLVSHGGRGRSMLRGWAVMALVILGSRSPEPIEGPLRNSRVWGRDTQPIPLLRPFDSAHATAHLRQGERNAPPPGMEWPYLVSRLGGRNDDYANVASRRMFGSSRDACVTVDHACGVIQITLPPSPRSYFDRLSTSGPGPSARVMQRFYRGRGEIANLWERGHTSLLIGRSLAALAPQLIECSGSNPLRG